MSFRLTHISIGMLLAAVLPVPAAHAFTVENKDAAGQFTVPKFDLEEQAKNFRKDGSGGSDTKSSYDTPIGKLQFGVEQRSWSGFRSGFGAGLGPSDGLRASRRDMDRMLAPPTSLEYNSPR